MKKSLRSFDGLKSLRETLKERGTNRQNVCEKRDDEVVFLEAMADVREIKEFREIPFKSPRGVKPRPARREDASHALEQIVKGTRKINLCDTGEYIEWVCPTVRKDIAKRLHRGDFSVQEYIDLHGMTLVEAEEALGSFLREALGRGVFCVKVIHGRGLRSPAGPVLKEALKDWLSRTFRRWVLAYATARDCDGGLGATYILLKSR